MAIKNLGSFKRTIGKYEMKLIKEGEEDVVLEFDNILALDIITLQELWVNHLKDDNRNNNDLRKFIFKHMNDNKMFEGSGLGDNDKEIFVITYFGELLEEYLIMFRILTRQQLDDFKKEIKKLSKKE